MDQSDLDDLRAWYEDDARGMMRAVRRTAMDVANHSDLPAAFVPMMEAAALAAVRKGHAFGRVEEVASAAADDRDLQVQVEAVADAEGILDKVWTGLRYVKEAIERAHESRRELDRLVIDDVARPIARGARNWWNRQANDEFYRTAITDQEQSEYMNIFAESDDDDDGDAAGTRYADEPRNEGWFDTKTRVLSHADPYEGAYQSFPTQLDAIGHSATVAGLEMTPAYERLLHPTPVTPQNIDRSIMALAGGTLLLTLLLNARKKKTTTPVTKKKRSGIFAGKKAFIQNAWEKFVDDAANALMMGNRPSIGEERATALLAFAGDAGIAVDVSPDYAEMWGTYHRYTG